MNFDDKKLARFKAMSEKEMRLTTPGCLDGEGLPHRLVRPTKSGVLIRSSGPGHKETDTPWSQFATAFHDPLKGKPAGAKKETPPVTADGKTKPKREQRNG